uniref:Tailspike n=1 Tax=Salmonella phage vB_SE130_2P TaxID=3236707 RepID=A0AB39C4N7_9VIRU
MVDADNPSGGTHGVITFENLSGDWGKGHYVIGGRTSYGSVNSAQFSPTMAVSRAMAGSSGLPRIVRGKVVLRRGKVR